MAYFALDFRGKESRKSTFIDQAAKLQKVGGYLQSPPLFLRKEEEKRHVLLAAGPAILFGMFFGILCTC